MWWLILRVRLPGSQARHLPRYLAKHYFWIRFTSESVDWVKQIALSNISGHQTTGWGPEQNKKAKKRRIHSLSTWLIELSVFFCPQTRAYTIISPGSQAFRLGLKYNTSFPRSPACRWQIVGLLRFHNHIIQSPIINLFITCIIYLYLSICVSSYRNNIYL